MTATPRSKAQDSLLAALKRQPVRGSSDTTDKAVGAVERVDEPAAKTPARRIGKPTQFWFHEEDRRILRELVAWLSGQGLRVTDSMVIRAALRTAKTGDDLLRACREAAELDGRLKRYRASSDC